MERREHVKPDEQQALRLAGMRVTPQRLAIMRLMRGSKAHPSPEMVYQELKPDFPGLSPNTVYQTLHSLEEAGLLRRISMEENVYRYDANVKPHAHLVCRACGRVDDTNGMLEPLLDELLHNGSATTNWDILAMDCCFYGRCPDCRKSSETLQEEDQGE
ncbi:MAG TPA: transcriptional repressor [Firmicutes bacterium]|nr:transcriptional repressor [Candidatus Fermentithermobacillaceae bacterium]